MDRHACDIWEGGFEARRSGVCECDAHASDNEFVFVATDEVDHSASLVATAAAVHEIHFHL